MDVGLVCDSCDFFNAMTAVTCASCGTSLSLGATKSQQRPVTAAPAPMGSGGSGAMQASAALAATPAAAVRKCGNCGADVAGDFKFCGACGTRMDAAPAAAHHGERKTQFFSAMQAPRPKLILIKGDGLDGSTYVLGGTEHIAGRVEGELLFPDDPLLSPRHANFLYGDGKLVVTDEGSVNGVFMRIRAPMALKPGDRFLVGEQLMQVETPPDEDAGVQPDAEGTHYFASPRTPVKLRLVQILRGGEAALPAAIVGAFMLATGAAMLIGSRWALPLVAAYAGYVAINLLAWTITNPEEFVRVGGRLSDASDPDALRTAGALGFVGYCIVALGTTALPAWMLYRRRQPSAA